MNIYEFMEGSPYLTFFLACVAVSLIINFIKVFFVYLIDRPLRHKSIRLHGYPPKHCDVDGDFKPKEDD